MLNWGDKESGERLAVQLKELLRDRAMTIDQLASCYSIRHGQSVVQRLKDMSRDRRQMSLGDFVAQMTDDFETIDGNKVKAKAAGTKSEAKADSAAAGYPASQPPAASAEPPVAMKYADVSRGIQNILKECREPLLVTKLEDMFVTKFGVNVADIVGMETAEYLQRKENIFDYDQNRGTVFLQSALLAGPPMADPSQRKDESFVVKEFAQLIEAMGPVVYISTLCGKFIQRNGVSVTSIISARPLDLFKRHPNVFLILGAGNVSLKKYEHLPEVARMVDKPSTKSQRVAKAAEEAQLSIPSVITEEHVVEEFRRLILIDSTETVYISSLCGRFLQRFKQPVTAIIDCKPAEFLRRYPDIFVMTGGGNVGLREVLGPDAVSVPPPPPRVPKALREDRVISEETVQAIELSDEAFGGIHSRLAQGTSYQSVVQRVMAVCRQVEQASFLALEEVVLGGAAGKGLVTTGPQAEIVLFVRQLPYKNFVQWLPHILETLAPVLEYQLSSQRAEKFKVEKDHLRFQLEGAGGERELVVLVYLSPLFKGPDHLMECIRSTPPAERFYFYPSMVKERNDFVGRQPQFAKNVVRLMTWWSSRQKWSSVFTTPSDWLLELVVIYTCMQQKRELSMAETIPKILEMLARFETLKVLWADIGAASYKMQDIWRPLLSQEPLFMDPLNPYCNLADINSFDPHELMKAAQSPGCFQCFKREVALFMKLPDDQGEPGEDDNAEDD
eukprot:gnl/TRDRNA2_/TRDRNA2_84872_c0_seq1.p1 gnl/TRDRNA2_/TRDRNA2_84872_c0~~gnl/TRDRNA2_/TRDRNA2_84872_c0_seq1.p1  ORF type:complete len:729 (-),score=162.91 gnl/TRDRNA2_/TRDRNA2_84872_c0_seq1:66-2252(-)